MMTRKELYQLCYDHIKEIYGSGEASAMSRLLVEKLGWKPNPDHQNSETTREENEFISDAIDRIKKQEPVQYITGTAWFNNMEFEVNPSVLIPRPETEELVAEAIQFLKNSDCPRIIDIGTGSGCIPISIARKIEACCIISVDVSKDAINTANRNAERLGVHIHLIQMDFLEEDNWDVFERFDCIISNPPYIPLNEKPGIEKNVEAYEPALALFVEEGKPLLFYEKILLFSNSHLSENGKVFLELHQGNARETAKLFNDNGYETVLKKDINNNDRILIATRCR